MEKTHGIEEKIEKIKSCLSLEAFVEKTLSDIFAGISSDSSLVVNCKEIEISAKVAPSSFSIETSEGMFLVVAPTEATDSAAWSDVVIRLAASKKP